MINLTKNLAFKLFVASYVVARKIHKKFMKVNRDPINPSQFTEATYTIENKHQQNFKIRLIDETKNDNN